jgi:hypothetical protein
VRARFHAVAILIAGVLVKEKKTKGSHTGFLGARQRKKIRAGEVD